MADLTGNRYPVVSGKVLHTEDSTLEVGIRASREAIYIETWKGIDVVYVLEILEFIDHRRFEGKRVNIGIIRSHMSSDRCVGELCSVVNCPPMNISPRVLRRVLECYSASYYCRMKIFAYLNSTLTSYEIDV
jgi:hypothetical protein